MKLLCSTLHCKERKSDSAIKQRNVKIPSNLRETYLCAIFLQKGHFLYLSIISDKWN